jgi:type IV pilus assembly protein PilB
MSLELLNLLEAENILTSEQKDEVIMLSETRGVSIPQALLESGFAGDSAAIIRTISQAMGLEYMDIQDVEIDERLSNLLSPQQAKSFPAMILYERDGFMLVAVPLELAKSIQTRDDIRRISGRGKIQFVISTKRDILRTIDRVYRIDSSLDSLSADALTADVFTSAAQNLTNEIPDEVEEQSQVVQFVDAVLSQGVKDRASDIHFDATERRLQIRYRIDGVLRDVFEAPRVMMPEIISRLKIMAELDISQTRVPQDGRITQIFDGRKIDMRVATLPSVWGEKVVLRILDNNQANLPLAKLNFSQHNLDRFLTAAKKPYGMVLVTGPTGSGKSTTLYAALNEISSPEVNVLTVEDPVEYRIAGITQVQVNNRAKMSFDTILRTFLRADPDIILVGEIRDHETATTAMQAGLTGHMVFSTLHTNDASSAIPRLADMGVEPFITASTLQGVASQRLIRMLCNKCKQAWEPTEKELDAIGYNIPKTGEEKFFQPKGCNICRGTGYVGRLAIHEVLVVTPAIQKAIIDGAKGLEVNEIAVKEGMTSLRMDGFEKVSQGLTSFQEVLRVTTV